MAEMEGEIAEHGRGALKQNILAQFLTESVVLCMIGGAIGLIVGIGATHAIGTLAGRPVLINADIVLVAIAAPAFVGIVFGSTPSRKAVGRTPSMRCARPPLLCVTRRPAGT